MKAHAIAATCIGVLLFVSCTRPAHACAQSAAPMGTIGQWLVGGSLGGSYEARDVGVATNFAPRFVSVEHTSVWLAPWFARFVATDFAVGASLLVGFDRYARSDDSQIDALTLGAAALGMYRAWLGSRTFLLPSLALGVGRVDRFMTAGSETSPLGRPDPWALAVGARAIDQALAGDVTTLGAKLGCALAFTPAQGLYLGIGPYLQLRYALSGMLEAGAPDWALALGIESVIGFWL